MNQVHIHVNDQSEDEELLEVTKLKPTYMRLLEEGRNIPENITDETERRFALEQNHKELVKAAFLTNDLATEEDFERLWPRMRDDLLCEHADIVYRQTMAKLTQELESGKSPEDYSSPPE